MNRPSVPGVLAALLVAAVALEGCAASQSGHSPSPAAAATPLPSSGGASLSPTHSLASAPSLASPTHSPDATGSPSAEPSPGGSPDPTAGWTTVASAGDDIRSCSSSCSEVALYAAAQLGDGFVAVGRGQAHEAMAWASSDGVTWRRAPDSSAFDASSMTGIAAGGPGVVAVGSTIPADPGGSTDAVAWTSSDGLAWSRVAPGQTFGHASLAAVVAHGQRLIAVGSAGEGGGPTATPMAWWSDDGRTWTRASLPAGLGAGGLLTVASGPGGIVVAGGGAAGAPLLLTSTDGRRWIRVSTPLREGDGFLPSGGRIGTLMEMAAKPGDWQATGGDGLHGAWLAGSSDGRSWHLVGFGPTVDGAGGYDGIVPVTGGWIGWYDSIGAPTFRVIRVDGADGGSLDISDPAFRTDGAMWTAVVVVGGRLLGFATTLGGFAIWARPLSTVLPLVESLKASPPP